MKTIRKATRNGTCRGGFSLSEMLVVVAIIAILAAVGFVNGVDMIRGSRQTAMDRQAEQIFLALSRNLQGLEASGYTHQLSTMAHDYAEDSEREELFSTDDASIYAYTNYPDIDTNDPFYQLLFPQSGLSAALSADLQNGYWLILFSPGKDETKGSEDEPKPIPDSISIPSEVERENPYTTSTYSSPSITGVYFARRDETPEEFFQDVVSVISAGGENAHYYEAKENRRNDTDGRVGYYGGEAQGLLSGTKWDNFRCWFSDVRNAEELAFTVACWVPDDPEYATTSSKTHSVKFTLTMDGETSTGHTVFSESVPAHRNSMATKTFTLDKFGVAPPTAGDGETWGQFLVRNGFQPGENLKFTLSAVNDDEVEAEFQDNNFTQGGALTLNSLFADGSSIDDDYTLNAKIAYGRHLQNLDMKTSLVGDINSGVYSQKTKTQFQISKISATQTQDITFADIEQYYPATVTQNYQKWAKTYENKTFLPVTNEKLTSYNGDERKIYNLTVNYVDAAAPRPIDSYTQNAGLFGTFSGDSISYLTLVDPAIRGKDGATQNAGGLAGTLSMGSDVTIDQCALYLTTDDGIIAHADDEETPENGMLWLTTGTGNNKYAGGLVGQAIATGTGKTLNITNSFASTVVKAGVGNANHNDEWAAGCRAGGLLGMAQNNVNVTINRCYTGSYLYGAYTGGLVGGAVGAVTIKSSYAAGFQSASTSAAGLLNGANGHIDHSYTVSAISGSQTPIIAPDTVEIDEASVFDAEGLGEWYQIDGEVADNLGGNFATWSSSSLNWSEGDKKTYPYNLKRQGLKNYTYPRLKPDFLKAYRGDWKPEVGILAYYEIYTYANDSEYVPQNYDPSDNQPKQEYRVMAEGLPLFTSDGDWTKNLGKITADSYGILLDGSTEPKSLKLSFGSLKKEGDVWQEDMKPEISLDLNNSRHITIDKTEYALYPIPQEYINRALYANQQSKKWSFYELVKITREEANGDLGISYYRFNPHFATIPNRLPNPNVTSVTWKQIWDDYLLWQTDEKISIRTARQLRNLSEYYDRSATVDYYTILSGYGRNFTFLQECDIDYRAYNWMEYAPDYLPAVESGKNWKEHYVNWETYATESAYYSTASQDRAQDKWEKAAFTQRPIAENRSKPFVNVYNGDCYAITGLSVIATNATADGEKAVGLFGWNGGKLENIVFVSPFDRDDLNSPYVVGRVQDIGVNKWNEIIYLGALAGYNSNSGNISNCATAGYYFSMSGDMRRPSELWDASKGNATDRNQIRVLNRSSLYAGGFVGWNAGTIQNASVSAPETFTFIDFASAYVGGFAGWNEGQISYAYSIGAIEADPGKNTTLDSDSIISLAGFCAGGSKGAGKLISHSYCAVSIGCMGVPQHMNGFAPSMLDIASTCHYLKGPVAKYLTELRNYDADDEHTRLKNLPMSESELRKLAQGQTVQNDDTQRREYWHDMPEEEVQPATESQAEKTYPYPSYVKDHSNKRCHYGNWLEKQSLGMLGLFYWEHEEDSANDGYHISFLGVHHTAATDTADAVITPLTGSTLCIRHNDGGVIKSYGYGYYETNDTTTKVDDVTDLDYSDAASSRPMKYNATVAKELREQWPDYEFFPYTTRTQTQARKDKESDYILMSGTSDGNGNNVLNSSIALSTTLGEGDDALTLSATYDVSPFFANAMQITAIRHDEENVTITDESCAVTAKVLKDSEVEDRTKDFSKELGKADNQYEIRSLRQLQYLNWNHQAKNATMLVTPDNKSQFNYLTYCVNMGTNIQQKEKATAYTANDMQNVGNCEPSNRYWWQTHDAVAPTSSNQKELNEINGTAVEAGGALFTPIAGSTVSSGKDEPVSKLLAWFGGHFDGQSYALQNFEIHSDSFTVGVFGMTVSAEIENAILYSNLDNAIERVTNLKDGQVNNNLGAYMLGGLIGVAYSYKADATKGSNLTIRNCAIAGYRIIDSSTNPHGRGGGNIGGLFGSAFAKIEKCSAVADIYVNCMPELYEHDGIHRAKFGSYVHVGGLIGAIQFNAENCYTGGEIFVGKDEGGNTITNTLYAMRLDDHYRTYMDDKTKIVYMIDDYEPVKNDTGDTVMCGQNNHDVAYKLKENRNEWFENLSPEQRQYYELETYLERRESIPEDEARVPRLPRETNLFLHLGGIAGSTYSPKYNVEGAQASQHSRFTNCYTYMKLPAMEGNIRSVSYIGGVADRFSNDGSIEQLNCWYWNGSSNDAKDGEPDNDYKPRVPANRNWYITIQTLNDAEASGTRDERKLSDFADFQEVPDSKFGGVDTTRRYLTWGGDPANQPERSLKNILLGNLDGLRNIQYVTDSSTQTAWNHNSNTASGTKNLPKGQSYDEMSDTGDTSTSGMRYQLNVRDNTNGAWKPVTNSFSETSDEAELEGRYSFPGSDKKLLGADYPFPTVLKQYDPVNHRVVSVHYGEWPLDGVYWQAYMTTMDIFGDMQADGWAEKTFTLCNVELEKEDGEWKLPALAFECSDETIATVVNREILSVEITDEGTNHERRYAECGVTIRAKKRGNVTVSCKYQKLVNGELVDQSRAFELTVTASGIETGYEFDLDENKSTPKNYLFAANTDSAITFRFYVRQKDKETPLYFTQNASDWTYHGTGFELDRRLAIWNGDPKFLNAPTDVKIVWMDDADHTKGGKIQYTAKTDGTPGEFYASATFKYDYHSNSGGETFDFTATTGSMYALGAVGLSNGVEANGYSYAKRVPSATDNVVNGVSESQFKQDGAKWPENGPWPVKPDPRYTLFLYETATDTATYVDGDTGELTTVPALQAMEINLGGIALTDAQMDTETKKYTPYPYAVRIGTEEPRYFDVNGDEITEQTWKTASGVLLIFDDDVTREEESDYQYRGVSVVRPERSVLLPLNLDVTIPVIDPDSGVTYKLTTRIENIGDYTKDENGETVIAPPVIVTPPPGEDVTPPSSGGNGGSSSNYNPYYSFFVTLHANGGVITVDGKEKDEHTIRANADSKVIISTDRISAHRTKYFFAGWNTKADGSGESFQTNTETTISDNLDLYAQWTKDECTIYFYGSREQAADKTGLIATWSGDKVPIGETIGLPSPEDVNLPQLFVDKWSESGWVEYDPNNPNPDTVSQCVFTVSGTKSFYPKPISLPVRMKVNDDWDAHSFTCYGDGTLTFDAESYQNPAFDNSNTKLLGWYLNDNDHTPALSVNGEDVSLAEGFDMATAYAAYQASGDTRAIELVNQCIIPIEDATILTPTDPNGETFTLSLTDVNFDKGDTLTIEMTLPTQETMNEHAVYTDNGKKYNSHNVISFGTEAGVQAWSNAWNGIHIYYSDTLTNNVAKVSSNGSITRHDIGDARGKRLKITFTKDELSLYVDNTLKKTIRSTEEPLSKAFKNVVPLSELFLGSQEGFGRSYATNYEIKLNRNLNDASRVKEYKHFDYPAADGASTIRSDSGMIDQGGEEVETFGELLGVSETLTESVEPSNSETVTESEEPSNDETPSGVGDNTQAVDAEEQAQQDATTSQAPALMSGANAVTDDEAFLYGSPPSTSPDNNPKATANPDDEATLYGWTPSANADDAILYDDLSTKKPDADAVAYGPTPESASGGPEPDSDEALYGWTPNENPENELPLGWRG